LFTSGVFFAADVQFPGLTGQAKWVRAMEPKLAMIFVLIGAVIALSHLTEEKLAGLKQRLAPGHWRKFRPARRKV
jgi:hypothetical protein